MLVAICANAAEKNSTPKDNYINVIVPENDTTNTSSNVYRLSASTLPGAKVKINGTEYNVYKSGAFCGLLKLNAGMNTFDIVSTDSKGKITNKKIYINKKEAVKYESPKELKIISFTEPSVNQWVEAGDYVKFQVKATSKCKAIVGNRIELKETKNSDGKLTGIYQTLYKVKADDKFLNGKIEVKVTDSTGKSVNSISECEVLNKTDEFPYVGTVKKTSEWDRPALSIGLGSDRLGGAKYQYINDGIKLKINGKNGDLYRVQLDNKQAWIDKENIELNTTPSVLPYSLTGNMYVTGNAKYDSVVVGLSEKLPYISEYDPILKRIKIEVFGAVSNTNWITNYNKTSEINNVYYNQTSKETFVLTIDLKHKQLWGYQIYYKGNNLVVKIKKQPLKPALKDMIVALDAGHGGSDNNGALGSTGSKEKDVNLAMVLELKKQLEKKGAKVLLTRDKDTNINNNKRIYNIMPKNPDLWISIHSNSIGYGSNPAETKGISTYYKHIGFRGLSKSIYNRVLGDGLQECGNVGNFNFGPNQPTEYVNALVELGYMSNPEDEILLMDSSFIKKLAGKIIAGTEDFLKDCLTDK